MKQTLFVSALILSLCAPSLASGWKVYKAADGTFTATFPGTPTVKTFKGSSLIVSREIPGGERFTVIRSLNSQHFSNVTETYVQAFLSGFDQVGGQKVLSHEIRPFQDYPAFLFTYTDGEWQVSDLQIYTHDYSYNVIVLRNKKSKMLGHDLEAAGFWKSFHLETDKN